MRTGWIASVAGAIATLVGLFLPWVSFANMRAIGGIIPPEFKAVAGDVLQRYSQFSGWQLMFGTSVADQMIRLFIIFAILPAAVALVGAIISLVQGMEKASRLVGIVQIGWAGIGIAILAFNAGNVQRLGHADKLPWNLLQTLLQSRIELGLWITLLGLVVVAVGALVAVSQTATESEPEYTAPAF